MLCLKKKLFVVNRGVHLQLQSNQLYCHVFDILYLLVNQNITAIITTLQRWITSLQAPSRSLTSNLCMNSLNIQWGDSLNLSISASTTLTIFQGSLLHFQSDDRIRKFSYRPFLNELSFSTLLFSLFLTFLLYFFHSTGMFPSLANLIHLPWRVLVYSFAIWVLSLSNQVFCSLGLGVFVRVRSWSQKQPFRVLWYHVTIHFHKYSLLTFM